MHTQKTPRSWGSVADSPEGRNAIEGEAPNMPKIILWPEVGAISVVCALSTAETENDALGDG